MSVAECISIPFIMPETPEHPLSGITCFLDADFEGNMEIVTEGFSQPVLGAYRMKSGMLVIVSEGWRGDLNCDVVVPTEHKLFYAGTMRPTPAKRFTNCPEGRNWYYEKDKRERISMEELANIMETYVGKFPIALDCDDLTAIPEATI